MKKKITLALLALVMACGNVIFAQTEEEKIAALIEQMPVKPGSRAPGFGLQDINGDTLYLYNFRGMWVVLDFWGSWCRYCVQGIPAMKEAYSKYHKEGLEIIGIDCNEPEETWKEAVAKYELPWVNLYNPSPRGEGVGAQYGIQAYPTKILIDPDGQVHSIFLGEDPAFYQQLDSIFGAPGRPKYKVTVQ